MKIATSLNIRPSYLDEITVIPRLAAAGFDGIDFNFCDLTDRIAWHDEHAADDFTETLAGAAAEAGLVWVQAHGPMFPMFSGEARDGRLRELCAPALRACGRLGVPWMVLHPETLPAPYAPDHPAEQMKRNVAFFQSLLPLCERYNVGLAIENLPEPMGARGGLRCYGGVPADLIEIIDALAHPLAGACWDTGHAKINRLDQRACLKTLGHRLKAVHIQENDSRNDDHQLPFSNGPSGVDWSAVTDGLRLANYQGAFTYEAHNGFRTVPPPLFDDALVFSAKIARYLADRVTA